MSKIVAVWGNSGSGKSLISCAIANKLTTKNHNVIVLNSDKISPMLKTYIPFSDFKSDCSLGQLLSGNNTNIVDKIHIHKSNHNLGFMALCNGENGLIYQMNWLKTYIQKLIETLEGQQLADYILVDCSCDILGDALTLYALERAQNVITLLSPDNKGTTFLSSQIPILSGGNFRVDKQVRIVNNFYRYSPVDRMLQDYNCEFSIPHCKDAYIKFTSGKLIENLFGDEGVDFENVVKKLVERIR